MTDVDMINMHEPTFLDKAKNKGYACPVCNNGLNGGKGIGLSPIDKGNKNIYCCHGCNVTSDTFGLYAYTQGLDRNRDFLEVLKGAMSYFRIHKDDKKTYNEKSNSKIATARKKEEPKEEEDHLDYYRQCKARIEQTDYLLRRGISYQTCYKHWIGYDPRYLIKNKYKLQEIQAIIIPRSEGSYTVRNADNKHWYRYGKKGNVSNFFNQKSLYEVNDYIFVAEAEIDALSFIEIGYNAIALGSTSNVGKFIDLLKHEQPKAKLFIALDNDEIGRKATLNLCRTLEDMKINHQNCMMSFTRHKDINDYLCKGKEELINICSRVIEL